ncbi:hypothetical protein D3C85_848320 [compost metagenome]
MKNMKQIILTATLMLGVVGLVAPVTVGAVDVFPQCAGGSADTTVCKAQSKDTADKIITPLVNTLLFILGAISVIMIIVSGIRYATSNGDSSAVTSAKNTLMYSVIGLIVAILAYAIVNFVLKAFKIL